MTAPICIPATCASPVGVASRYGAVLAVGQRFSAPNATQACSLDTPRRPDPNPGALMKTHSSYRLAGVCRYRCRMRFALLCLNLEAAETLVAVVRSPHGNRNQQRLLKAPQLRLRLALAQAIHRNPVILLRIHRRQTLDLPPLLRIDHARI